VRQSINVLSEFLFAAQRESSFCFLLSFESQNIIIIIVVSSSDVYICLASIPQETQTFLSMMSHCHCRLTTTTTTA